MLPTLVGAVCSGITLLRWLQWAEICAEPKRPQGLGPQSPRTRTCLICAPTLPSNPRTFLLARSSFVVWRTLESQSVSGKGQRQGQQLPAWAHTWVSELREGSDKHTCMCKPFAEVCIVRWAGSVESSLGWYGLLPLGRGGMEGAWKRYF